MTADSYMPTNARTEHVNTTREVIPDCNNSDGTLCYSDVEPKTSANLSSIKNKRSSVVSFNTLTPPTHDGQLIPLLRPSEIVRLFSVSPGGYSDPRPAGLRFFGAVRRCFPVAPSNYGAIRSPAGAPLEVWAAVWSGCCNGCCVAGAGPDYRPC